MIKDTQQLAPILSPLHLLLPSQHIAQQRPEGWGLAIAMAAHCTVAACCC
jgi:hypothetical protein